MSRTFILVTKRHRRVLTWRGPRWLLLLLLRCLGWRAEPLITFGAKEEASR